MWGISHLILISLICFANVVFSRAFDQEVPAEARFQPPKHLREDQIVPDGRNNFRVPSFRPAHQIMRHDSGSADRQNSRNNWEASPQRNTPLQSAANPPPLRGRSARIPDAERFQAISRGESSPSMFELGSKSPGNPVVRSRDTPPPLSPRNKRMSPDDSFLPPPTVDDVSNVVRSLMPKARDSSKGSSRRKSPQGQRVPTKADTQLGASRQNSLVEKPTKFTKNPMYQSKAGGAFDSTGSRGSVASTTTNGSSKGGHSSPWPIPDEIIYLPQRQDEQRRSPSPKYSLQNDAIAAQIDEIFKDVYGSDKSFNGSPISTRGSRKNTVGSYPSSGSNKYSSSGMMSERPSPTGSLLSRLDSPFPGMYQAVPPFPVSPSDFEDVSHLAQSDSKLRSARRTKASSFENLRQKIVSKLKRKSKSDIGINALRSVYDNVDGSLKKRQGSRTGGISSENTVTPKPSVWQRLKSRITSMKRTLSPSRPSKPAFEKDEDFVFLGSHNYNQIPPIPSHSA